MNHLIFKLSSFLIFLISIGFLYSQPEIHKDYRVYDVQSQREITLPDLVSSLEKTDVLFWGEEHNDSLGHILQDSLYTLLLEKYDRVTLSMEMFETDCQQVLDEYLQGFITEEKMIRDARAWKNYSNAYRSLVEQARNNEQTVIAANAPQRYVNLVGREGKEKLEELPKSAQKYLPSLPIFTADSAYYSRFQEIMGEVGHGSLDSFFEAQCTWDASMAFQIYQHWRKHKKDLIFHLNGRFHTDYKQGTIAQLNRLNRKIQIENISCFPVSDLEDPDWEAYSSLGDFVILSQAKQD